MNVLIIDDHPAILDFLVSQVNKVAAEENLKIFTCTNLSEAQEKLKAKKIDRVICDLNLTVGMSLTIPEYCLEFKIPYLVFSSHVNNALVNELLKLNVCCYVSKGSEIEFLQKGIVNLLGNIRFFCNNVLLEKTVVINKNYPKPVLSRAEFIVIKLYAEGKKTEDISKLVNLQITTIRNHRARACEKNLCSFNELIGSFLFWEG